MVSTQRRLVPRVKLGPDARLLTLDVSSTVGIQSRPTSSVTLRVSSCGYETTLTSMCVTPTSVSFDLGNCEPFTKTGLYKVEVIMYECIVDRFEVERNAALTFCPKISEDACSKSNWQDDYCDTELPTVYEPCQTTGGSACGCGDLVRGGCPACLGPTITIDSVKAVQGRFDVD